jgi:arginase
MNIYFPMWQGSGSQAVYKGANSIKQTLSQNYTFTEIEKFSNSPSVTKNNINSYDSSLHNLQLFKEVLEKEKPDKIFTIGGDCSIDIVPSSYLHKKYSGDLTLVWFDAHGDINTPSSSPSKELHGMPLRILLGEGDESFLDLLFSKIETKNIVYIGLRDLDPPEKEYLERNNITVIDVNTLRDNDSYLQQVFSQIPMNNVYIHIDLDVLDAEEFSDVVYPTPDGMTMQELVSSVKTIKQTKNVVGGSVVEFTGDKKTDVDFIATLFSHLT